MARRGRVGRYLSYVLRHRPGDAGLSLDAEGWVAVDELLAALAKRGLAVDRAELEAIVRDDDKQRYLFDECGDRLRAAQGHSVAVDLGLVPLEPPAVLYHGTTQAALASILVEGLTRGARHHVHLSTEIATARRVGRRRGPPAVLRVAAAEMDAAGHVFLRSANGVWLTAHVPPSFLTPLAAVDVDTVTLWRPVGPAELALIEAAGWRAFPPRLPEQPFFYPVLNETYAAQIAATWNVQESGAGFVVRFTVEAAFADRYPLRTVGAAALHRELWVPAEELAEFNAHLVGTIELVARFP